MKWFSPCTMNETEHFLIEVVCNDTAPAGRDRVIGDPACSLGSSDSSIQNRLAQPRCRISHVGRVAEIGSFWGNGDQIET